MRWRCHHAYCVPLILPVPVLSELPDSKSPPDHPWFCGEPRDHIVPDVKVGGCTVYMGWLSGYLAMATGLLVTICVQSSSITTSALTPLVGLGVIKVETMYPTVLGANIGTCITGILAALAASADKLEVTLQVAYAHLLFNISGILIWYACWPLRAVPIAAAKFLGNHLRIKRLGKGTGGRGFQAESERGG